MFPRLLSLLILPVILTGILNAAPGLPELTAEHVDTDTATGDLVLTGRGRFFSKADDTLLLADSIRYNPQTGVAVAIGHVSITRGTQRILADKVTYNLDTKAFNVERMRLGDQPLYMSGSNISGTTELVVAENANIFFDEPGPFSPAVSARKITYERNKLITAENARIGIGPVRPVFLPKYEHPLNHSMLTYVDFSAGYRSNLGVFLGAGAHFPFFPKTQLGGDATYYSRRGLLFGPSGTYKSEEPGHEIYGAFNSGFISDSGEKLNDVLGRPISEDRGFAEWKHRQVINEHINLIGQVNYWKDSEILRDFRPEKFYPDQIPDSFFEGTYNGDNYVISAFTRVQPNRYFRTQQRLPEIRFDLLPTAFGGGVYERFSASAAVLREDAVRTGPTLRSDRFDAYYSLERPIVPREWFNLTPVIGGRVTHYARATGGKDDYTRTLGEVGADASIKASGTYAYKNERWGIDGIRHLVTPKLSYRYIPSANKGRPYIPAIDRTVFSTYLQPLGLGDQRNIDDLSATNTLRFGLDNLFQTRDRTYGSRDLLMLNIAGDLRFDREPGVKDFSAIHTEVAFTPADWLRFDVYENFTPQNFSLRELNSGITLHDGNVWSLRVANHYLNNQIQEYLGEATFRFNESYSAFAVARYDSRLDRFTEQSFGVEQNVRNIWIIRYGVTIYDGPRRESDFGYSVNVRMVSF